MPAARRHIAAAPALPGIALAAGPSVLGTAGAIEPSSPRPLTLPDLDAPGVTELETRTPWTLGPQRFDGVPRHRLLDAAGSRGNLTNAQALNDYAITSPITDLLDNGAFLAIRLEGAPIPVRRRGSFRLVSPYSPRPGPEPADNRRRAVWQPQRLDIA